MVKAMTPLAFWSGLLLTEAVRVNDNGVVTSKSRSEGLAMLEHVSTAAGFLSVEAVDSNEQPNSAGCTWNTDLATKYHDEYVVGTGATACVYLATDSTGATVAIKIAKQAGRDSMWRNECHDMQNLRVEACAAGKQFQELAERYLPTCVEVGGHGTSAYYVMQAAGTTGIEDKIPSLGGQGDNAKLVFAQAVAAIYSLHGLGYTHNDLHGHNIVLDGLNLALIDFGEIKPMHRGLGYKHDVNSVWRWANELAGCGPESNFPMAMRNFFARSSKAELESRAGLFLQCIEQKWNPGDDFISAFRTILDGARSIESNQHLVELFNTEFVQSHMPPPAVIYPFSGDGQCSSTGARVPAPVAHEKKKAETTTSGRPTVDDRVKDKRSGRCATITQDDHSTMPYRLQYSDGTQSKWTRSDIVVRDSGCTNTPGASAAAASAATKPPVKYPVPRPRTPARPRVVRPVPAPAPRRPKPMPRRPVRPVPVPRATTTTVTTTVTTTTTPAPQCASLDASENAACKGDVSWAFNSGKLESWGADAYGELSDFAGVAYDVATISDFQRLFFCGRVAGASCDLPPCGCTSPPCHTCEAYSGPTIYKVVENHHCGGQTISHWADGATTGYGRRSFGGTKFSDVAACEAECDAHKECTGFNFKESKKRCSYWKSGTIAPYSSPGQHCHHK